MYVYCRNRLGIRSIVLKGVIDVNLNPWQLLGVCSVHHSSSVIRLARFHLQLCFTGREGVYISSMCISCWFCICSGVS